MDHSKGEEEEAEPVSPTGQYFNSNVLCVYIVGVLESEVPIDDSQTMSLLKDVFLPINPRLSSIMVSEENGEKKWKKVEVKLEEHIKVPIFPPENSPESYDQYFDEYLARIGMERPPENSKPLWEIHIFKYPTRNAAGTLIFKLHHALGDGYSLMGALLSCLQRVDNPTLPLSFPFGRRLLAQEVAKTSMFWRLPLYFSMVLNTISDFGQSLRCSVVEDDKTPIRSGDEGVEFRPITITTISFSLDYVKEIKSKLGVTINDVITGIIFLGIRLYMQGLNYESREARSTALVLLNTRNVEGYQSIKDMIKTDARGPWGNKISFLQTSIPQLSNAKFSNPLEFVFEAHQNIRMKRSSLAVPLTGMFLEMVNKFKGQEAAARHIYKTLRNSSTAISNLVGPVEQMALANHPIKGFYFTMTGGPESVAISIMSYMGKLRVTLKTEKGFIDEQKLKSCMGKAYEMILKAAQEIHIENNP
ncbi:O-acyltransferase WSD1 [Quillaja saponaria]|uniref:O-acyltransferase WSD1 n=1 Tax=Quillaja saponaria TaxID=32244 RepID=A0AAD7Q3I7_QUISA|nr:O-acyltransferase WSD1 [Quillaja saponaria]